MRCLYCGCKPEDVTNECVRWTNCHMNIDTEDKRSADNCPNRFGKDRWGRSTQCSLFTNCRAEPCRFYVGGHYFMEEKDIAAQMSPFELPAHRDETGQPIAYEEPEKWVMAIIDLVNHASNICHAMGLENSTAQLETMAKMVMGTMMQEIQMQDKNPLLALMQKLLDTGNARQDKRTLMEVAPLKSVMSDRIWRTSMILHSQILKANQFGWMFYENIHLMLEQREAWCDADQLWLIAAAIDYIEGRI